MDPSIDRSVWGTSTDDFKSHFRQYLKDLAANDSGYRAELIERLEWCFDRWDYWRQKFFADTAAPLWFPFFEKHSKGSELGSYATVGNSGQPSVISLKYSLLMGDRDMSLGKLSKTKKLVLKADHPDRLKAVDLVILHELVHQYLHEGADKDTRNAYRDTECAEGKKHRYKGHGPLFAAECNRIVETLHPELGFKPARVRHMKRSHAALADVQRVSCGQFGLLNLLFAWDPTSDDLNSEQQQENHQRFHQALEYFGGAIVVVTEEEVIETDFPAPYDPSCADTCHQQLAAYDQERDTDLVTAFHLAALKQMQTMGTLDEMLQAIGHSVAPVNIPPAAGQNGSGHRTVAVPESGPTVPTAGDVDFIPGDVVHHPDWGDCSVSEVLPPAVYGCWTLKIVTPNGERFTPLDGVLKVDDAPTPTVPTAGDKADQPAAPTRGEFAATYPVSDPVDSLRRLNADIEAAGGKAALCKQFGLKDGSTLSRHLKKLRTAVDQLVAA